MRTNIDRVKDKKGKERIRGDYIYMDVKFTCARANWCFDKAENLPSRRIRFSCICRKWCSRLGPFLERQRISPCRVHKALLVQRQKPSQVTNP